MLTKEVVLKWLASVADPEIPTVNIVEFGMVHDVHITDKKVCILLIPTFLGCPALDIIKQNVENELHQHIPMKTIDVTFITDQPWTTERIQPSAIEHLKAYGIAPPPKHHDEIECPYCGSVHTTVDNLFGPTACRSILYCSTCKNPFEAMKPMYLPVTNHK